MSFCQKICIWAEAWESLSPQDPHACRTLSSRYIWGCAEGMIWGPEPSAGDRPEGVTTYVGGSYLLSPAPSFCSVGGAEGRRWGVCAAVGEGQEGLRTTPGLPDLLLLPYPERAMRLKHSGVLLPCLGWALSTCSPPSLHILTKAQLQCHLPGQSYPGLPEHTGLSQGTSLHTPRWKVPEASLLTRECPALGLAHSRGLAEQPEMRRGTLHPSGLHPPSESPVGTQFRVRDSFLHL